MESSKPGGFAFYFCSFNDICIKMKPKSHARACRDTHTQVLWYVFDEMPMRNMNAYYSLVELVHSLAPSFA